MRASDSLVSLNVATGFKDLTVNFIPGAKPELVCFSGEEEARNDALCELGNGGSL